MPAYFSIEAVFPFKSFNDSFVKDIYSILFTKFPYLSGYWNSQDNSLIEITELNQKLLGEKFILGYEDHVSNNYKQILMYDDCFSEIRSYWTYGYEEIKLSIIIPEYGMLDNEDCSSKFREEQLEPMKDLCSFIWARSPVMHIQSCLELDYGSISTKEMQSGELPSIRPISIVENHMYSNFKDKLQPSIESNQIQRNGILMINKKSLINIL